MASLSLTAIAVSSASVNLTSGAWDDWAHWGDGSSSITPPNRKSGGGSTIEGAYVNTATSSSFSDSPRQMSWTDGTPTASSTNNNGIWLDGAGTVGSGCRITFPADTTTRQITIYFGTWAQRLSVVGTLSDGSASPASDTTTVNDSGTVGMAAYATFEFAAGSAGQNFYVDITCAQSYNGFSNTTLSGAGVKVIGSGPVSYTITPSGGISMAGAPAVVVGKVVPVSGGITFSGAPVVVYGRVILTSGGISLAGTVPILTGSIIAPTGGVTFSGTAPLIYNGLVPTPGAGSLTLTFAGKS